MDKKIPTLKIIKGVLYTRYGGKLKGEMIDGYEMVDKKDPNYHKWLKIAKEHEKYFKNMKDGKSTRLLKFIKKD